MFNTPFGFNGFNPFPSTQGFNGFQGFQGFQGFSPSWNQGFNAAPWAASNNWSNTPSNWTPQSFGGFGSPFSGFQGSNGFSPWNQTPNQWAPSNWFNSPFASQFGNQFGNQFGSPFGNQFATPFGNQFPTPQTPQTPQTPFGFNWWNADNAQTETGTPAFTGFQGAPFGYNPFTGFNPAAASATQAA